MFLKRMKKTIREKTSTKHVKAQNNWLMLRLILWSEVKQNFSAVFVLRVSSALLSRIAEWRAAHWPTDPGVRFTPPLCTKPHRCCFTPSTRFVSLHFLHHCTPRPPNHHHHTHTVLKPEEPQVCIWWAKGPLCVTAFQLLIIPLWRD